MELCICSPYRNMAVLIFFNSGYQFSDDLGGCVSELIEFGDESFGDGTLVTHHLPKFPIVDSQVYCEAFNEVEVVFHPCLELSPGKLSLGCVAAHGHHDAGLLILGQSLTVLGVNQVTAWFAGLGLGSSSPNWAASAPVIVAPSSIASLSGATAASLLGGSGRLLVLGRRSVR